MIPALCCGGSLEDARGEGLAAVASFCFFLAGSGSTDGDAETPISSSLRFLPVLSDFLPVADLLAVGVLALRFKDARALVNGLKRFLKAEPISPRRRAASSASWAARAALSRTTSGFLSFLGSDFLTVLGFGSGVATAEGETGVSGFSLLVGLLSSISMNLVLFALASARAL